MPSSKSDTSKKREKRLIRSLSEDFSKDFSEFLNNISILNPKDYLQRMFMFVWYEPIKCFYKIFKFEGELYNKYRKTFFLYMSSQILATFLKAYLLVKFESHFSAMIMKVQKIQYEGINNITQEDLDYINKIFSTIPFFNTIDIHPKIGLYYCFSAFSFLVLSTTIKIGFNYTIESITLQYFRKHNELINIKEPLKQDSIIREIHEFGQDKGMAKKCKLFDNNFYNILRLYPQLLLLCLENYIYIGIKFYDSFDVLLVNPEIRSFIVHFSIFTAVLGYCYFATTFYFANKQAAPEKKMSILNTKAQSATTTAIDCIIKNPENKELNENYYEKRKEKQIESENLQDEKSRYQMISFFFSELHSSPYAMISKLIFNNISVGIYGIAAQYISDLEVFTTAIYRLLFWPMNKNIREDCARLELSLNEFDEIIDKFIRAENQKASEKAELTK